MTLTLDRKTPYPDLVSDFMAIPEALLLFLSKLKEIRFKYISQIKEGIPSARFAYQSKHMELHAFPGMWKGLIIQMNGDTMLSELRWLGYQMIPLDLTSTNAKQS